MMASEESPFMTGSELAAALIAIAIRIERRFDQCKWARSDLPPAVNRTDEFVPEYLDVWVSAIGE